MELVDVRNECVELQTKDGIERLDVAWLIGYMLRSRDEFQTYAGALVAFRLDKAATDGGELLRLRQDDYGELVKVIEADSFRFPITPAFKLVPLVLALKEPKLVTE